MCTYSWGQAFWVDLSFMIWFKGILTYNKIALKSCYALALPAPNRYWIDLLMISSVYFCRINGFKVTSRQSWRSYKNSDLLGSRLRFSQSYIVNRCSSGGPGSIPGNCKLWGPTIWQPLSLQIQKLNWKIQSIFIRVKRENWLCSTFKGTLIRSKYHQIIA